VAGPITSFLVTESPKSVPSIFLNPIPLTLKDVLALQQSDGPWAETNKGKATKLNTTKTEEILNRVFIKQIL
jgi:hypothetical protein